ncbi:hypothetical protein THAOC_25798, partial [Thalassiosira oceanica]
IVVCKDGVTDDVSGIRGTLTQGAKEPKPNASNAASLRGKSRGLLHSSINTESTEALTASLTSSFTSHCQLRDSIASQDASLRNSFNLNPFQSDQEMASSISTRKQFNSRRPPAKLKISSRYQLRSSVRSLRSMLDEFPNSSESMKNKEEWGTADSFETPASSRSEPCLISPPALEAVPKGGISLIEGV